MFQEIVVMSHVGPAGRCIQIRVGNNGSVPSSGTFQSRTVASLPLSVQDQYDPTKEGNNNLTQ